ncbi:hypothetical protein ACF0H5_014830 [Mactra antiquata]
MECKTWINTTTDLRLESFEITPDLVHMMSDVELSNYMYLPVHGDRLRLRQYLNDSCSVVDKRNKLLKTMHEKMEQAKHRGKTDKNYSSSDEENPSNSLPRDIVSAAIEVSGIVPDDTINPSALGIDDEDLHSGENIIQYREVIVKLHRGHVLNEMVNSFKAIDLNNDTGRFQTIMPNGKIEIAEDGGGVTRDSLTEFWDEFYEQCTLGTSQKVPFLRHDFDEEEWRAVAKIICFGWTSQGYFPLQLSLPFMEQSIFGLFTTDVAESFYKVVPDHESKCLRNAITDFSKIDLEELLDVLDAHDVRKSPNQSNIARIVQEIAHKELIQTPMFVAYCWGDILKNILITEDQLNELYLNLKPSPRSVIKLLSFPDTMTIEETSVSQHLKRFVRELDSDHLRKFLRFTTGSDLMIIKTIYVSFVNVTGFARRPVAHTCSCMLEISSSYESYPQFRSEFISVLESNIWIMDII